MGTQRITQEVVEALVEGQGGQRITQEVVEVLVEAQGGQRITQVVVEVLREDFIPVPNLEGWGARI